jgi:hypothetical protein
MLQFAETCPPGRALEAVQASNGWLLSTVDSTFTELSEARGMGLLWMLRALEANDDVISLPVHVEQSRDRKGGTAQPGKQHDVERLPAQDIKQAAGAK